MSKRATRRSDVQEKVKRGAEFLDEREPGWIKRIDLKKLDMLSPATCILGQLQGSYAKGLVYYDLYQLLYLYGFDAAISALGEFSDLTRMWRREIKQRLLTST